MGIAGKTFCFLLAGVMVLLWNTSALAKVLYVSPDGSDLNDGTSWIQAKRSVTAALEVARAGDQIWARYGVYYERITLKEGVSLYGGFRGTEQTLSERPSFPRSSPDPYETVLDGQQGGSVVTTPTSASRTYRLDGFTVRNGRSEFGGGLNCGGLAAVRLVVANCTISQNTADYGGGVYCYYSSPTLTDCTISGNTVNYYGGGVYCEGSSPTLTDCTISGNTANHYGGGVSCYYYSSPTLTNCTFSGNTADGGGGVSCYSSSPTLTNCTISGNTANGGGGVFCEASSPTLTDCTISGNTANYHGGGVFCYHYSSPTLTNCTISGNTANGGGGVYCYYSSSPTLTDCTISGNTANYFGGGVYCYYYSSPTLTNCTISGNTANYFGGGVYCYYSSPTLTNCTISGNTANGGGGVYCYHYSSPTLTNCTISGNTANGGGGVYCYDRSSPTLTNCTISGNTANHYGGGVFCRGSSPTLTNCTIAHNAADVDGGAIASDGGGSVVNTLIAFNTSGIYYSAGAPDTFHHNCVWGNDAYNYSGIPDPTGTDGNISTDPLMIACHLLPGSPCIDAGDNGAVGSDWTDFDGEPRIGGSQVDIGADEFYAPIVQGWITFSDYVSPPPPFVPFEVRAGSTEVQQILVDPDGGFVVPGVPVGAFALSVKPLSYLRRTVDVDTRRGSVLGLQLELVNGDIDGDNEVTLFDFGRLVAAFGSARGDANWDENADLDGDEEITLFDFGILVRNFGEVGDD
jgi:parallel beta-helix repeat protein